MSKDTVFCDECSCVFITNPTLTSYQTEKCPDCGNSWTGDEKRSTMIEVTMPTALSGGAG
jgi:uncharacterized paraquat-inducible protein A